jgi:hypothetical protein
MGWFWLIMLGLAFAPSMAWAQAVGAPHESVTVTGTKSREVLQSFVQLFAAPTRLTGNLARWEVGSLDNGICPFTVGLRPEFVRFINRRLKDIARQVGAPVNGRVSCKPNIEVVFTTSPQALLDGIRKDHPAYLGYHETSAQAEQMAKVTHPIQVWYMTETKDLRGKSEIDTSERAGVGAVRMAPNASAGAVTGERLGDGMRNAYHIIIVADPNKLAQYEMGPVADYISMLALTQLNSQDTCRNLPSIVNLLASHCEPKANAITDNDLAYLRGLYRMNADRTLRTQQDEVAYQTEQSLEGRWARSDPSAVTWICCGQALTQSLAFR